MALKIPALGATSNFKALNKINWQAGLLLENFVILISVLN
jgi:hypothetical protein